jgi:protein SCO1/2
MKARTAATILLLLPLVFSCGKKEQQESDLRTFTLRGEVVAIDPSKTAITIAHEEVPGYMMAMTMPFTIKDPSLLAGVEVGDSITGTLSVSKTERWIKSLEVTRKGRATDSLATGS